MEVAALLSARIDTDGLETALAKIDKLGEQGEKVEKTFEKANEAIGDFGKTAVSASDDAADSLEKAAKETDELADEARRAADAIDEVGDEAQKSGKQTTEAAKRSQKAFARMQTELNKINRTINLVAPSILGLDFAGGIQRGIRAFADFEKSLIGVSKTANLDGAPLDAFSQKIQQISLDTGVAATTLLDLGASAAQVGVGSDNLLKVVDAARKLESASNLTGEDAINQFARLLNITGEGIGKFEELASITVALGNNFAATEAEIAKFSIELAKGVGRFGVTSDQLAALGASTAALGLQPELTRTSFSKLFQTVSDGVNSGGKELQKLAAIANVSGEQFKNAFDRSAFDAVELFLKGLGEANEAGIDQNKLLKSLKLTGEGIAATLPTIANAYGGDKGLAAALKLVNEEREKFAAGGSSLDEEAARAAEALSASFDRLGASVQIAAVRFGGKLAPALKSISELFANFVSGQLFEEIISLLGEMARLSIEFASALLGPLKSAFGALTSILGVGSTVLGAFGASADTAAVTAANLGNLVGNTLVPALAILTAQRFIAPMVNLATNFNRIRKAALGAVGPVKTLGLVLKANPIGIAATAIGVLTTAFTLFNATQVDAAQLMEQSNVALEKLGITANTTAAEIRALTEEQKNAANVELTKKLDVQTKELEQQFNKIKSLSDFNILGTSNPLGVRSEGLQLTAEDVKLVEDGLLSAQEAFDNFNRRFANGFSFTTLGKDQSVALSEYFTKLKETEDQIGETKKRLDELNSTAEDIEVGAKASETYESAMEKATQAARTGTHAAAGLGEELVKTKKEAESLIDSLNRQINIDFQVAGLEQQLTLDGADSFEKSSEIAILRKRNELQKEYGEDFQSNQAAEAKAAAESFANFEKRTRQIAEIQRTNKEVVDQRRESEKATEDARRKRERKAASDRKKSADAAKKTQQEINKLSDVGSDIKLANLKKELRAQEKSSEEIEAALEIEKKRQEFSKKGISTESKKFKKFEEQTKELAKIRKATKDESEARKESVKIAEDQRKKDEARAKQIADLVDGMEEAVRQQTALSDLELDLTIKGVNPEEIQLELDLVRKANELRKGGVTAVDDLIQKAREAGLRQIENNRELERQRDLIQEAESAQKSLASIRVSRGESLVTSNDSLTAARSGGSSSEIAETERLLKLRRELTDLKLKGANVDIDAEIEAETAIFDLKERNESELLSIQKLRSLEQDNRSSIEQKQLELSLRAAGEKNSVIEREIALLQLRNQLERDNVANIDQIVDVQRFNLSEADRIDDQNETLKRTREVGIELSETLSSGMLDALNDFEAKGEISFKSLGTSLLSTVSKSLPDLFKGLQGSGGLGGLVQNLLGGGGGSGGLLGGISNILGNSGGSGIGASIGAGIGSLANFIIPGAGTIAAGVGRFLGGTIDKIFGRRKRKKEERRRAAAEAQAIEDQRIAALDGFFNQVDQQFADLAGGSALGDFKALVRAQEQSLEKANELQASESQIQQLRKLHGLQRSKQIEDLNIQQLFGLKSVISQEEFKQGIARETAKLEIERLEQLKDLLGDLDQRLASATETPVDDFQLLLKQQKASVQEAKSLGATQSQVRKLEKIFAEERRNELKSFNQEQLDAVKGLLSASELTAQQAEFARQAAEIAQEAEKRRLEELGNLLGDLDQRLASATETPVDDFQLLLKQQKASVQEAEKLGATQSQIAKLEEIFAEERRNQLSSFNEEQLNAVQGLLSASELTAQQAEFARQAAEVAQEAEKKRLDQLGQLLGDINQRLASATNSPIDDFRLLERSQREQIANARELGATTNQINKLERLFDLERIKSLEAVTGNLGQRLASSTESPVDDFRRLLAEQNTERRNATALGASDRQLSILERIFQNDRASSLQNVTGDIGQRLASSTETPVDDFRLLIRDQRIQLANARALGASQSDLNRLSRIYVNERRDDIGALDRAQLDSIKNLITNTEYLARVREFEAEENIAREEERLRLEEERQQQVLDQYNEVAPLIQERINAERELASTLSASVDQIRGFREGLDFSDFSVQSPIQQLELARQKFDEVSRAARLGDVDAVQQFQAVSDQLLRSSRLVNASDVNYAQDLDNVRQAALAVEDVASRNAALASSRADVAQSVLDSGSTERTNQLLQEIHGQNIAQGTEQASLVRALTKAIGDNLETQDITLDTITAAFNELKSAVETGNNLTEQQLTNTARQSLAGG